MWAKSATALFAIALTAISVAVPAPEAGAQDDSCKYAPRLEQLPACQATYCAAGKTDPAFQARLFKIDDTLHRFGQAVSRTGDDFDLRRLTCRVVLADPVNSKRVTADSAELYRVGTMEIGLHNSLEMADTVRDQDLFAPEAATLATTYHDQECSQQLSALVNDLIATTEKARKQSEDFDCDKGEMRPANAPPHLQSCKDFVDTFKRLFDANNALQKLTECKTGCTEAWQCLYARNAKMNTQNAAQDLVTYKARCAPQNPTFFAQYEKRVAEINAMSKDATRNCR